MVSRTAPCEITVFLATVMPVSFVETVVRTAWKPVTFPRAVLETIVETVVKPVTSVEAVVFTLRIINRFEFYS